MRIIYHKDDIDVPACVATVGFFDGVHAGHRFLIDELKAEAGRQHLPAGVITFAVHPRKVLNSDFQPQLLNTLDEKLGRFETTGIDYCIVLDFSLSMARLSAYEFLKTVLQEKYHVKTLFVGHDHRFGHNRSEGFGEYKAYGEQLGMEVIKAGKFRTDFENHVSSSHIRAALLEGRVETASKLLSYDYFLSGKVEAGFRIGSKIGFPTANIAPDDPDKLVPGVGVYAVKVTWKGNSYVGMLNIGNRPTLDNGLKTTIEVHIIDFSEDIYGETLEISFVRKIRDEQKFANIGKLVEQLHKDRDRVLGVFGNMENE
ncbi:MAG TPA: bifunctional riboflavin kinase/FAD synthetase [Paludibacter sp.]|nr:bifunctional riboflavin kinase/FAD synthetase [Paludibacter sp.]